MDRAEGPGRYLQYSDGSWAFVGPDGWPVELEDYAELDYDAISSITAVQTLVVDVQPVSVRDVPLRRELRQ